MTPLLISAMVFLTVAALVGVLAFVFRDGTPQTATRLDLLVGKRSREADKAQDILRKQAFEGDKKNLMESLTPKFFSPTKMFEQADCHIKPSTLFGIGLVLALLGATATLLLKVPIYLAPFNGLLLFSLPWAWLWNKRRAPPSCPTPWSWSHGRCEPVIVSVPACTS
jgi:tight adherence protein B